MLIKIERRNVVFNLEILGYENKCKRLVFVGIR